MNTIIAKRADDLWSVYGSFGMVQGEVFKDGNNYYTETEDYRVHSTSVADENGVVSQTGAIRNSAEKPIRINYLMSKFVFEGGEYAVYTQSNTWQNESMGNWQPLITTVGAEIRGLRDSYGAAPFFVLWNKQANRGHAFHILANCAWKYTVSKVPCGSGIEPVRVEVEVGINNCNFSVELAPGEELAFPQILHYDVFDPVDLDCYKIHNYMNREYPRREMPVIYNTWLCRFERVTFDNVVTQVAKAAELGVEYFVTDAGWYGEGNFWDCRGDWEERTDGGYAGRMRELSGIVRKHGMQFGFWLEMESGGGKAKAVSAHKDYYFQYQNMLLFDFANPTACNYIVERVCRLIEQYNAKFIKFDFNQDSKVDIRQSAFLDYYRGYRSVLLRIKNAHPDVYMEGCGSGGLRMSIENGKYFDSFWFSDNQSPYEGMRIYKDTIRRMPPQMIERWAVVQSAPNLGIAYGDTPSEDRLISINDATWKDVREVQPSFLEGFLLGSPVGLSCDLTQLSPAHFESIRKLIAEFKASRAFWKCASCRILVDTESVLSIQYSDPTLDRVEILTFSWRIRQNGICIYPVLDTAKIYQVSENETRTGKDIRENGIAVELAGNYTMTRQTLCSVHSDKNAC